MCCWTNCRLTVSGLTMFMIFVLLLFHVLSWTGVSATFAIGSGSSDGSLDYISLTDYSRRAETDLTSNSGNATQWHVGLPCDKLQPGCECQPRDTPSSPTTVICNCDAKDQVVKELREYEARYLSNGTWNWKVTGCSKVIIHRNFLSAIFKTGSPLKLQLEFENISQLVVHEESFFIQGVDTSSKEASVSFTNCGIATLPKRAFPFYLTSIQFKRCTIGNLSEGFIQTLRVEEVIFDHCKISDITPGAFNEKLMLQRLIVTNSSIQRIHPTAISSAVQQMSWSHSTVYIIEKDAIVGPIANVIVENCRIFQLEKHGFSVKSWSSMILTNNSFSNVGYLGFDLTHNADSNSNDQPPAILQGNTWKNVHKDFIYTGTRSEPFVSIRNTSFLNSCSCESNFLSTLSLNASRPWFHQELFNSSRCPVEPKELRCLQQLNNTAADGFILNHQLAILCSPELFMCLTEVRDLQAYPTLPNRLKMVALAIGAFVIFMVVSLLLTLLVYMIKRQGPSKEDSGSNSNSSTTTTTTSKTKAREMTQDVPRKQFVNSLNTAEQLNGVLSHKMPKTPSMPSRVALLEDVEMEDKGVQTLPTDLSADIIEGLREKLSKPDSFWDAKQTIDHLYDLIHVREPSSPQKPALSSESKGLNGKPIVVSSFAQTASGPPATTTAAVGPTASSHIYSELPAFGHQMDVPPPLPSVPPPLLCDYTQPHDYQSHIYADLLSLPQSASNTASVIFPSPNHLISTSFSDNSPTLPHAKELRPLQPCELTNGSRPNSTFLSNATLTRPLPSIPAVELGLKPQQQP